MSQWSNWEQKFAWLPKRIVVRSQVGSNITYTTIARTELIWMKKYWQRKRISIYYTDKKNYSSNKKFNYYTYQFKIISIKT